MIQKSNLSTSVNYEETEINTVNEIEQICGPISVILTVVTNLLLLCYEVTKRQRRNSVNIPRLLVLLLSSADMIAICFGYLPVWISYVSNHNSKLGLLHFACAFLLKSFWTLSQCLIVIMAVERFTSMKMPYFYVRHFNIQMLAGLVFVAATYSMGISVLPLLSISKHSSQEIPYVLIFSTFALPEYDYVILGQSLVLLVLLLFCNLSVMKTLRAMEANVCIACPRDREEYLRQIDLINGTGREFSRLMATISFVFLICSLPNLIRVICRRSDILHSPMADYIAWHITLITGFVDPFLYGLLRRKIRDAVRTKIKECCVCYRDNKVRPTTASEDERVLNILPI